MKPFYITFRARFFYWLRDKVFKHESGVVMPWYLIGIRLILFPIDTLKGLLWKKGSFYFDYQKNCFVIYGIEYSEDLFRYDYLKNLLEKNGHKFYN